MDLQETGCDMKRIVIFMKALLLMHGRSMVHDVEPSDIIIRK
jgi:hypothetical protein